MKQIDIENLNTDAERLSDGSHLLVRDMETVMHESMLPYAEYVILDRAIPRVEDGLKPVQRRILYAMYDLGVTPDKGYKKSARIVGECLGKYHPHGDTSVYDAMVRMAQPFNLNMCLVDGQGNFGSVDGDGAAAMRYTETKLTELAMELIRDIDKDTVKWSRNFDDTTMEPDVLPGRYPNLLVNGASGIAVGLATNIPPHNLAEVIDGVVAYIDNKNIKLSQMMKIINGPDFPTGGYVIAGDGLKLAYETGRGKIQIRAKAHIEQLGNDKCQIVITELPYQVNKAALLMKIVALREDRKEELAGINEIVDESDKDGMRAVIKIKKDFDPKAILEYLFKYSDLQTSFGINMVAIADGKPQQMGLLDIISYYTDYQRDVVLRRSRFELTEAQDRKHIIEGLVIAVSNIDEVIAIIKAASNVTDAKQKLRVRFDLTDKQAQAILDIRLARLTKLEIEKLQKELEDLLRLVAYLQKIVNNKSEQMNLVKTEMLAIRKCYKRNRLSEIIDSADEAKVPSENDEKPIEERVIALAYDGTIKNMPVKNFLMSSKDANERTTVGELHTRIVSILSSRKLIFFTNKGNCLKIDTSAIPECKYREKGADFTALFGSELTENERPVNFFALGEEGEVPEGELLTFTRQGMVKRTAWADYNLLKSNFQNYKGKEDDEIIAVEQFVEGSQVLYVTKLGMCLNFANCEVPVQGRMAGGVKGMNLSENDSVVYAAQIKDNKEVALVTDKCFFKRVAVKDIPSSARYRKGVKIFEPVGTNGSAVMLATLINQPVDIALMDAASTMVVNTDDIPKESRASKGKAPKLKKKGVHLVGAVNFLTSLN